jgi:phospholipid/cholesterol/gamma-HCH transport system substrate-binding protein
MRRSVREALVGFSLLAAMAGGLGLWFWLKGISLSRNVWTIQAGFADAAGLAVRSPVAFRGVQVGSVRGIRVTGAEVVADLEITDPSLVLSRPVVARVGAASLLGGDAVVSLLSAGKALPPNSPRPRERNCDNARMVCDRGKVSGVTAASLDTVTETVQKLLDDAERQKLVPKMVAATKSFEQSARETEKLSRQGQVFIKDTRGLVSNVNRAVVKADPIITNLNAASVNAARASKDVSRITASLSTSGTVSDLQATLANARRLTDHWQAVGGDLNKLTGDPKFIDGIRSVAVGLGSFFEDLYPAQVDAARQRDGRHQGSASPADVHPAPADGPPLLPGARPTGSPPPGEGRQSSTLQPSSLRPRLAPMTRKQRVLSAADQREADRERAAAGIRSR